MYFRTLIRRLSSLSAFTASLLRCARKDNSTARDSYPLNGLADTQSLQIEVRDPVEAFLSGVAFRSTLIEVSIAGYP